MGFDFVKEQYDVITEDLLNSEFTINATIVITGEEVTDNSTYRGMNDTLDGRFTETMQSKYPLGLPRFKRVKMFPLEKMFTRHEGDTIQDGIAGQYSPFDRWLSVALSDVGVRGNETYFDYADTMSVQGVSYKIKGVVKENFGNKGLVHIFLIKNTEK